jgi:hypothetical protein
MLLAAGRYCLTRSRVGERIAGGPLQGAEQQADQGIQVLGKSLDHFQVKSVYILLYINSIYYFMSCFVIVFFSHMAGKFLFGRLFLYTPKLMLLSLTHPLNGICYLLPGGTYSFV